MSEVQIHTDSLGDLPVRGGMLRMGPRGNWLATVLVAGQVRPVDGEAARVEVTREDGTVDTFAGSVRRSSIAPNTVDLSVTIVGGKGHLIDLVLPARHSTAGTAPTLPAGLVLAAIAQDAGEALAPGVEAAADALPVPRWTRVAGEATDALDTFADVLGQAWRVHADGAIWVGVETWPAFEAADLGATYWMGSPRDGTVLYSTDGARLRPGMTIDGARIVEVTYYLDAEDPVAVQRGLRCEARSPMPGDPLYLAPLAPYRASYVGTVLDQAADGTLHIACDDPTVGADLRNIPLRVGIPGCTVTVPNGARVRVLFESASPKGCYAAPLDQDPAATKALSLLDDDVKCGTISGIDSTKAPVQFIFTPTKTGIPGAPSETINVTGFVFGPGHKYAKGVPNA